jgi:dinuclear metal center YbgI/SA1388 family protein
MYTAKQLYHNLSSKIPTTLSCKWDNDGAMCLSDPDREIKRVLVTLDITAGAVDFAIENNIDAIVSHHPLIFTPIRSINGCDVKSRVITKLMRNGISALSFHTRLDAVEGGVNDVLASLLSLQNCEAFVEDGIPLARIGTLAPIKAIDLAQKVKKILGADSVGITCPDKTVEKIVIVGGGGKDFIDPAIDAFADCLITGEVSYNAALDAADSGLAIITAGHFFTENPVLSALETMIKGFYPTIEVLSYNSNLIQHI